MVRNLILLSILGGISSFVNGSSENLIVNGDFAVSSNLRAVGSNLEFTDAEAGVWFSGQDTKQNAYYNFDNGYANPMVGSTSNSARKLLQRIAVGTENDYKLSFDYRLTNDQTQFSVVRLLGIKDIENHGSAINMNQWDPGINEGQVNYDTLYDQGGYYSYLTNSEEWSHVENNFTVDDSYDSFILYAYFSYDDNENNNLLAGLDNFVLSSNSTTDNETVNAQVPEPATMIMLSLGGLLVRCPRKNGYPRR